MGCSKPPLRQEISDGRDEPSASANDRGHDNPQSVAGDAAILPPCGVEIQPVFWALARSARTGRRARLPGSPGVEGRGVGIAQPGRLRAAVLLRRDAWPGDDPGADRLCRAPRKLPTVLGGDEIVRFLESVSSLKARVALTTAYAAGL